MNAVFAWRLGINNYRGMFPFGRIKVFKCCFDVVQMLLWQKGSEKVVQEEVFKMCGEQLDVESEASEDDVVAHRLGC